MSNIKSMIDKIINDTRDSYKSYNEKLTTGNDEVKSFDATEYKNRLSMCVLKDIISAMMHDETKDLDCTIDQIIMKHIKDNNHGSCYDYLKKAGDTLKSPIITDIISNIDNKTANIKSMLEIKKDDDVIAEGELTVKEILKDVDNYDELREKIKEHVSQKVIDDVSGVITKSNDAPVFDDIDEKLSKSNDGVTVESIIVHATGAIVSEYAMANIKTRDTMSVDDGMNQAIIEYCLYEMDKLFKQKSRLNIYSKYL